MKIAFYSDNFYPELSGISDTIITTGKELRKRGHEIIYVAPYYPTQKNPDTIDGIPIVRLPSVHMPFSPTGESRLVYGGGSLKAMQEFKPDIIHTQSPYGVGLEATRVAKKLDVPLVGTNHTAIEDFFPFGMRSVMRRWDAHYFNRCKFVTAPYARLLERMREVGFRKQGKALPNPADLHEFTPPTPESKAEHRKAFGLEGPTILYAGRLGVEKRVEVMVKATALLVKKFPTVTFLATGHGAARPSLDQLVKKLGIEKNVRFTGFLSRAALPHAYQAADMFGMTSTSDSQSLALMQAYASGLPAVLARSRGLPDYAPESSSFLIEPGNAEEFAAKAERLLSDESLRARMGAAAVEYVTQFSPDKIAGLWEDVYGSVRS